LQKFNHYAKLVTVQDSLPPSGCPELLKAEWLFGEKSSGETAEKKISLFELKALHCFPFDLIWI
jgi:hypothetical protein